MGKNYDTRIDNSDTDTTTQISGCPMLKLCCAVLCHAALITSICQSLQDKIQILFISVLHFSSHFCFVLTFLWCHGALKIEGYLRMHNKTDSQRLKIQIDRMWVPNNNTNSDISIGNISSANKLKAKILAHIHLICHSFYKMYIHSVDNIISYVETSCHSHVIPIIIYTWNFWRYAEHTADRQWLGWQAAGSSIENNNKTHMIHNNIKCVYICVAVARLNMCYLKAPTDNCQHENSNISVLLSFSAQQSCRG